VRARLVQIRCAWTHGLCRNRAHLGGWRALTGLPIWAWIAGGGALGAILGSFMANIVVRWPRGESVVRGRSRCDSCGNTLGAIELMPLLGGALSGWRCRKCGAAIDRRHAVVETTCALAGAVALAVAPGWFGVAGLIFACALVALAALDLEHFWLPDALTLPLAAAGAGAAAAGLGPKLTDSAIGLAAGWSALTLLSFAYRRLRRREGLGGGDAKLLAAIGAWLGWQALPLVVLAASMAGLAGVAIAWGVGQRVSATYRIPFGALLSIAAFAIWLWLA
jgi:leader peptidase (prepilin peptidase) / N-methyltransferase